jgi:conjugative transfer region protein (TIGR03748 family)
MRAIIGLLTRLINQMVTNTSAGKTMGGCFYKTIKAVATFLFLIMSLKPLFAFADTQATQVGRYLTIKNKPNAAQTNLLSQAIQVRFPPEVQSVGDAMNYVLRLSGYSLVPEERMSSYLKTILAKPLPAVDRDFGPMSLRDGLTTLAGPAFYLVQDPLNRMVDFRVKQQYLNVYTQTKPTTVIHHKIK